MSVSMLDNFNIRKSAPNVERDMFQTIADMKAYNENYLPQVFIATCVEDGCLYLFNKDNDVNPTTGKWRKFEGSNSESIQKEVLPTASATEVGNIYQFIGATDTYTKGYFYICSETIDSETGDTVYAWVEIKVQKETEHIDLTMEEYDELPESKTSDDNVYFITDDEEEVEDPVVYSWTVDPDESDPYDCIAYGDDAVGMTPASMGRTSFYSGSWGDVFFIPRPCMLKSDCTVDYYLDPNDYSKKEDGTPSDIANPDYDGNAMMEWGLIWFKFEAGATEGAGKFSCSNKKIDDDYDCPCNKDADGNIVPHFYTAIYNGTGTEKLRSLSGVQLTTENGNGETTGLQEVTRATANNTTAKYEWLTDVYCDRVLINALHVLISKSLDSQKAFGRGLDGENDTAGARALKESYVTGTLDTKGLFYGDTEHGFSPVKTFGMENWWGCEWRRIAGLLGIQGRYIYKMTQPYVQNGHNYIDSGVSIPYSGDISKCAFGTFGFLPIETSGSVTTYYADTLHNNQDTTRTYYGVVGDCTASGTNCGISALGLHVYWDTPHWSASTTLSCKPLASRFGG